MARAIIEIRSLARSYTRTALKVLVGVMGSKDASAAARVSAANAILDRGWGKAPQAIQNGDGGALELIQRHCGVGAWSVSRRRAKPSRP